MAFDRHIGIDPNYDLPVPVRSRIAGNLGNGATVEGAAIVAAQGGSYAVPAGSTAAAVQQILTAAPAGSRVVFAPGTYAAPTDGWTVGNDDVQLDATRATLTQATWCRPVLDLNGRNGMRVDVGTAQFTGVRAGQGSSYRFGAGYISSAAVWVNGDRNDIRVRHSINLACGVTFSGWTGTGSYDHQGVGNRVQLDEAEGYDFAILWAWQKNLTIVDVYGHDDIDDSAGGNPTHVLYGSADTGHHDEAVTVLSGRAKTHRFGQPFQFKFSDRLTASNLTADSSRGVLNTVDCHDITIDGVAGTQLLANGGAGSFTMQSTTQVAQRPRIRNVSLQLATGVDERGFLGISDDGEYTNITVQSAHSAGVAVTLGDLNIRGLRNRLSRARNRQTGTACRGIVLGPAADGTVIDAPVVTGALAMVNVTGGSVGVVVDYDPTAQQVTEYVNTTGGSGTETYSTRSTRRVALSTFGEDSAVNLLAASGTVTVGAVNSAIQRKIRPTRDIAVSGLRWWSAVQSGNYDVAIYDDATNARLWSKGATLWPAPGMVTETVTGVTLRAGRVYRIAFSADNATATLRGITAVFAGLDILLDGGTDSTTVGSVFPLPNPLVAGSGVTSRTALIVVTGT